MLNKDRSVIDLLKRLAEAMGKDAFDVVDRWEDDRFAVGIARSDNRGVLVYVCTFGKPADHYFVSLELPPTPTDDYPYTSAGELEVHSFQELVGTIKEHFASYP